MEDKKLVVITGASSGFGLEMAKMFAEDGYPLLLLARRVEKMEALNLPNTLCKKVDVTDKTGLEKAIRAAEAVYGETDLLINNAGVMLLGSIETQNANEWQKMLDVNVMGVMHGMQTVIPSMKARKGGTIINLSSMAGYQAFENHAAYCASKFGVRGLTQTARLELSPFNVRVITIEPGAVKTELLEHTTDDTIIKGYNEWKESVGAVNITAKDVAKTIKFAYELPQSVLLREIVICDTMQDA
ncbi:NADP-dependent 3-hydroxy acid dehydrogenase YdfG [Tenacibaculum mesophilum]|uniref:SDR family oxidoreductase n=1 Tax=Tenacibaculum mesophilum TaxID=104268 RepID=A0ABM7CCK4_9FLAO|nr:SDR family oxidoreductase [Tenacibaculum mesophilum]AZJ31429.1 SDR family oxidoreductase [Tenacibaculum mesophilum]QFS29476.1 SDR family NAD(P)-dependent oxidoreductase [Tenacibaculum mesophilum]GFD76194.1 oxidoreductase [Tenacibaculum sp. KUL113]SHF96020.1 NADP-dependent 3-hydroxy acid dehydrogenase YdfG [Tenacibaculum mesophilum]